MHMAHYQYHNNLPFPRNIPCLSEIATKRIHCSCNKHPRILLWLYSMVRYVAFSVPGPYIETFAPYILVVVGREDGEEDAFLQMRGGGCGGGSKKA
mmetsp:Transcript_39441/g.63152  ORF Transcript_39441/g.63152 Transcript_39441/m.63152 type:complete len:96 (-) Transcript_39441:684-971(-)